MILFEDEDLDYGTYGTFEFEEPIVTVSGVGIILS